LRHCKHVTENCEQADEADEPHGCSPRKVAMY
jgi:hypothetical protein